MKENKYIITYKHGQIKRFKFPISYSHYYFARDNGYDYYNDVIETGLLIDGHISVLECRNKEHLSKARLKSVDLNEYHNLRLAREAESRYIYNRLTPYILRDGD
jgi:hypothetical protein